jgi:hypothetical protein
MNLGSAEVRLQFFRNSNRPVRVLACLNDGGK